MVAACADIEKMVSKSQIFMGVLQFLTVYFLFFGWIWSIYWGYLIWEESKNDDPVQSYEMKNGGLPGQTAGPGGFSNPNLGRQGIDYEGGAQLNYGQ